MTKRKTALALSLLLTFSMFITGCGEEADATETQPNDTTNSVSTESPLENTVSSKAKVTIEGTKFMVDGKELWINGVNTPWDKWNDFGGGFEEEFWDTHFADLKSIGVNATRIWVNCNGMVGIRLKTTGEIKEITELHWEHLDKLFELAKKHEIYLMPTLLSFDHFKDENLGYDRWRLLVSDDTLTKSFVDSYVIPFVKRYGDNPYLWSIDLMNEPDWVVENAECGQISWKIMAPFFAKCAAAIHENSDVLVTVGLGMVKYNSDKFQGNYVSDEYLTSLAGENAYLDFYSTHYYWWQKAHMGFPFELTPEEFGLTDGKPCVIGETSANSYETGKTLDVHYKSAYDNGWNGVMAWTSNGVDDCGGFEDCKLAASAVWEIAPEKIFPLG